jgi:predicted  nucleic acid-binding Zn-ribbon protein
MLKVGMEDEIKTIEDLGALMKRTRASKENIKELRTEMNQKFEGVETRLDRIENLLLANQEQHLNDLETRMKKLEDALAV